MPPISIKAIIAGIAVLLIIGAAVMYRADLISYGGSLYAAKANAAAVKALEEDAVRAAVIIEEREARIAELEGRKAEIVKEIVRVEVTRHCVNSPAVGAALGGLRDWQQPRAGQPKGPGKPDGGVPAAPRTR